MEKSIPKRVDARTLHFTPLLNGKASEVNNVEADCAVHIMGGGYDAVQPWGTADLLQVAEESTSVNQTEGFCQVYGSDVQWLLLFPAVLLQLA